MKHTTERKKTVSKQAKQERGRARMVYLSIVLSAAALLVAIAPIVCGCTGGLGLARVAILQLRKTPQKSPRSVCQHGIKAALAFCIRLHLWKSNTPNHPEKSADHTIAPVGTCSSPPRASGESARSAHSDAAIAFRLRPRGAPVPAAVAVFSFSTTSSSSSPSLTVERCPLRACQFLVLD